MKLNRREAASALAACALVPVPSTISAADKPRRTIVMRVDRLKDRWRIQIIGFNTEAWDIWSEYRNADPPFRFDGNTVPVAITMYADPKNVKQSVGKIMRICEDQGIDVEELK